jgi:hypothetical protein
VKNSSPGATLLMGVCVLLCVALLFGDGVRAAKQDFYLYYAGGKVERSSTFDNKNAVQQLLKRDHLFRDPKNAPYPYGTVSLIALVFVPLSFLSATFAFVFYFTMLLLALVLTMRRISHFWSPVLLAALLFSYPALKALLLGNWSLVTTLLVLNAFLDLREGRTKRAGIWLGISIAFKIYPAFLLIPLLIKRQYESVSYALYSVVLSGIASCLLLGWSDFVHGLGKTLSTGADKNVDYLNMSLPGVVVSLSRKPELLVVCSFICCVLSVMALYRLRHLDLLSLFVVAIPLCLLSFPVVWDHYLSLLFIVELAVAFHWSKVPRPWKFAIVAVLIACWLPWDTYEHLSFFGFWPAFYQARVLLFVRPIYTVFVLTGAYLALAKHDDAVVAERALRKAA